MSLPTLSYDFETLADSWRKLVLSSNDPSRTEIVDADDPQKLVYRSRTNESGRNPVTTYTDASGDVLATLEWHLFWSDKLSVRGGPKQNVGKWLKRRHGTRSASFSDENGRTYTWQEAENGHLQLFAEDDATLPMATFIPAVKATKYLDPDAKPAAIIYSERASSVRDEVVLFALLLERARRLATKDSLFSSEYSGAGLTNMGMTF